MIEVVITTGGREMLRVTSDGEANFRVQGASLRGNRTEYDTTDDLNIMGQVVLQLGALLSGEVLRRALDDRAKEGKS